MSRHFILLGIFCTLLCACSRQQPPVAATPAEAVPSSSGSGSAQDAILTATQRQALQKVRALEPRVLQQKEDMDKKIDAETSKD